jgi:elongation factor Ts
MAVTTEQIKQLRDKTGISMMACKNALELSQGDVPQAIELLRKQGQATASKRAGKQASEGQVQALIQNGVAGLAEINCETDFVATNADFGRFVSEVMQVLIQEKPASVDLLKECKSASSQGRTVSETMQDLIAKCGEKMDIERIAILPAGLHQALFSYVHGKGKIAVVVLVEGSATVLASDAIKTLGKDLCLQICSANPHYIRREEIPVADIEKEREIYRELSLKEGKPEKILEKIIAGRLEKFYQDVVLPEQLFIKDTTIPMNKYIADQEKLAGGSVKIVKFIRFQLGDRG